MSDQEMAETNSARQLSEVPSAHGGGDVDASGGGDSNASPSRPNSQVWHLVNPIPPDAFVTVLDVVGEVFHFCDTYTLLQVRQVCWAWHEHEVFTHFCLATQVLGELRKEEGREVKPFPDHSSLNLSMVATRSRRQMSTLVESLAAAVSSTPSSPVLANTSVDSNGNGKDLSVFERAMSTVQQEMEEFDLVDEGWVVESGANRANDTVTVAVLESERYYPVVGWIKKRLPGDPPTWQRLDQKRMDLPKGLDSVEPSPGWTWVDEWKVWSGDDDDAGFLNWEDNNSNGAGLGTLLARHTATLTRQSSTSTTTSVGSVGRGKVDANGWGYAMSFTVGNFGSVVKPFARRREWRRAMRPPRPTALSFAADANPSGRSEAADGS